MINSGLKSDKYSNVRNEGSSKLFDNIDHIDLKLVDNIDKQWDLITSINQVIFFNFAI